jgi:hypothetical protein
MRDDVQLDYDWQRRYIPARKRILADVLGAEMGLSGVVITEASFEEDTRHNTDLIVLNLHDLRIAVRTRRYKDLHAYHDREDLFTFLV